MSATTILAMYLPYNLDKGSSFCGFKNKKPLNMANTGTDQRLKASNAAQQFHSVVPTSIQWWCSGEPAAWIIITPMQAKILRMSKDTFLCCIVVAFVYVRYLFCCWITWGHKKRTKSCRPSYGPRKCLAETTKYARKRTFTICHSALFLIKIS